MPIGDQNPAGIDAVWVKIRSLEQSFQQLFAQASGAKNIATAVQTGLGTLAGSGTTWAGPVASPSTITAATDITSAGTGTVTGVFKNPAAYSNSITSSFRALYTTSVDGQIGFNLSSIAAKQDVADYSMNLDAVRAIRVVAFRYIEAVNEYGKDAENHVGLIAEWVHDLGLTWLVDYHAETGKPDGIKFDRLAVAALALAQQADETARDNAIRLDRAGL